ncbi:hypothetical protein GQX74_005784, partial [Glossina fuscipes]
GNPTQLEAENYKRETKENEGIYLRNTKLPLRLLMNPRGRMRDFNSCTVHEAFNTDAGLLSPNNCAELLTALRGYKDKGAELFAKRRKVAEKWVVDETNVGAQRPSDLLDYYEQQQQSQHASSPNMLPAYKAKDRKQSNVQQNQLLEQSGLNAAEKLDETALTSDSIILKKQTNKMEFSNSRSISNLPPPIHREFCLTEKEDFITLSKIYPQILHGVTSNSSTSDIQRDLAYKPCIPQGWKTPSINLPQNLYVPKKIPLQSYAAPPSFSSCTSRVQMIFPNKKYQSYDLDNGRPKQIQRQTSAIVSTSTLKNSQPDLLGSKNSRHISSIRVNEVSQLSNRSTIPTQETGQNTTQVNFNPSQLPQAKLAKFGHASSEPRDVYSDKRFLQIEPNISKISPANAINLPKPLLGACDILHQRNFRYPKSTLGQHNLTNSRRNDSHILYAPTYNNSACGWSKYNVSKSVLTNQYRTSVESAEAQLSLPCMPYTDF